MTYPDDDNGDVLRRLLAKGDDLSKPRNIDFTIVFPDEESSRRFAEYFCAQGYSVSVELANTVKDFPWDVVVVRNMAPSHQEIGNFEYLLQGVASRWGGHNDGWGCLSKID